MEGVGGGEQRREGPEDVCRRIMRNGRNIEERRRMREG